MRILRLVTLTCLFCAAQLHAQTITGTENDWKSTASGAWSTAGNWSLGTVPGASDTVAFTSTSAASAPTILSLTSTVRGIVWKSGAASYTLSASSGTGTTFTIGADGLQNYSSNTQTITGSKVTLNLGTSTFFDVGSSGNLVLSPSGGSIGLGANTLTLKGSSTGTGTISSVISGTGSIIKSGTGTWTLSGTNTYTGATTLSGGVLSVATIGNGGIAGNLGQATNAAANLVFDGGTLQYTGATASTDRNFTINTGKTATFDITTNTLTLSGASTATNGALTKIGAGTLTLSGANAYTGATIINAGTLKEGAANVISDSSAVTVAAGATYDLNSFSETIGSLAGGGTVTSGAAGALTLTAGGDNTSTLFSGVIQNGSGTFALTKSGTGTLTLSGANTYTGITTISGGTLQFAKQVSLYNNNTANWTATNIVVQSGATAAFNVGGTGEFTSANIDTLKALGTASGGFKSGSFLGLDTTNASGASFTYSSAIANPNGGANVLGLTKLGSGTLVLTGASTYTGATTINGGTLKIDNNNTTTARLANTSGITVNSGGTLLLAQSGGTASTDRINNAASVTIKNGGTFNTAGLSEGSSTAGSTAALGALTLEGGSTIDFKTGANGSTLLASSGIVSGLGTISILNWTGTAKTDTGAATNDRLLYVTDPGFSASQLSQFQFYDDSGALFVTGAMEIAYNGFTEIVPVPEPSTYPVGFLALGAIAYSQRKRFKKLLL